MKVISFVYQNGMMLDLSVKGISDPYIVLVSTPNAPDGLFEKIEKEPESSCIYKRLKLDYTYGLNCI